MGSGDNWASQIQRFVQNGFCEDRLFVFDWNSISGTTTTIPALKKYIDDVLIRTKAAKVNLVGHSAGGGLCYALLRDSIYGTKAERYVHIGSNKMKTPAGPSANIPTLNIYSTADMVAATAGEIPGATNVKQAKADHMQVATSEESFDAIYSFFTNGKKSTKTTLEKSTSRYKKIGGRGVLMAENKALSNDSFRVNIFDPKTGEIVYIKYREKGENNYNKWTTFDSTGGFKLTVSEKHYLQFEVKPNKGRTVYYYFEPAIANNSHYYLRAIPQTGMASSMLKGIPKNDTETALVIFSANSAIISGRDSLAIDSIPLSLPMLMPASKTTIACFLYDDGDGNTSTLPLKSFAYTPFLAGADVFIPANNRGKMRVYYNGRSMVLPKIKSSSGISVAVFQ
jgi:hypothetical protein